jgi:hypothetical protein
MKTTILCLAASATIGLSGACLADDMVAAKKFSGTSLGFLLTGALSNTTLSVAGPDDFHASAFSKSGAVAIDLGKFGPLEDGVYNYQVTAATDQPAKARTPLDNGRSSAAEAARRNGVAMSGTFTVKGGQIVEPAASAKESRRDMPTGGTAK